MNPADTDPRAQQIQTILEDFYAMQKRPHCRHCKTVVLGDLLMDLFAWAAYQPKLNLQNLYKIEAYDALSEALRLRQELRPKENA
jgi:hypothetical protein